MSRYLDPKTDFGFKRLFAQEDSKDILKQFLFDVLKLTHPIEELTHIPNEQLPQSADERIGVYDVYCKDVIGQGFIVEIQRANQTFIRDRVLSYSTFPIIHQAKKGTSWQFELMSIYCIAIVNFSIDTDADYLRRVQLMDTNDKTVFYDKLTYVYIELPKFNKTLHEIGNEADKWIYLLKNMPELQDIPAELANEPFPQAFEMAEQSALSPSERLLYEASLKSARDTYAEIMTARREGIEEGRRVIAQSMIARGLDIKLIAELTEVDEDELRGLLR